MPDLRPIVEQLDGSIRETIPGLRFAIKWKKAYYGLPELGWIIEMVSYDVSVNVVFFGGADLDAPPPLGTTDRSRYVKLTSLEDARGPEIHRVDRASGARAGLEVRIHLQGCRRALAHHGEVSPPLDAPRATPARAAVP